MEFILTTDIAKSLNPTEITFNYEQIESWLTTELAPYKTLVVTENEIPAAKKTKADINRLRDAIDGKRKDIKKLWMQPYTKFEDKCKALTALCDETSGNIGAQLEEYEVRRRAEKLEQVKAAYAANIGEMGAYLPFKAVYSEKWLNVTTRMEAIVAEIVVAVDNARASVKAIRDLGSPYTTTLLEYYAETHDLAAVLTKDNALKQRAKAEAELQKTVEMVESVVAPQAPALVPEETSEIVFKVWATPTQLRSLKAFLIANNIKYGRN